MMKLELKSLTPTLAICLAVLLAPMSALGLASSSFDTPPNEFAIEVTSTPVPLNSEDVDQDRIGPLVFRGGLELTSTDDNFGGLSGLLVSHDGSSFVAVTDLGYWVKGQLTYKEGALAGVKRVEIAPLLDLSGEPISAKTMADAESITGSLEGSGPFLVSFERHHRIWSYPFHQDGFAARPTAVAMPDDLSTAKSNGGLESILLLPAGQNALLAITEDTFDAEGNLKGWVVEKGASRTIGLAPKHPFSPTDLGLLPNGDLLLLERRYAPLTGVGMGLRHIKASSLVGDQVLDGPQIVHLGVPYNIDNMEGLAVRTDQTGRTLIYIVSDDNFNPLQRTLLLMFELTEDE